ncbi:MAG TPA: hypothetical protein VFB57_04705 [Gaiellaceae bacterium]|jgi:hypothetical protein|nr:hypothetical protein [Gaiellaceae bacterium]
MRWLTIGVAVLGLALVGAGCGGGDEETADDDATVTITTETDTETTGTTDEGTTDDGDTSGTGVLTEDCLAAVSAFVSLSQAVGSAATGGGSGASQFSDELNEFADKAPAEVQDDIRVLAEAYAAFIDELSDLDLQEGQVPSGDQIQALTEASEKLNTPEVTQASENFNAWAQTNCPR